MKRLLIVCLTLLIFSVPVLAQETNIDPAAYLPARTPFYIELRTEPGIDVLEELLNLNNTQAGLPQTSLIDNLLTPQVSQSFPGIDFRADILSWVGDRIGVSASTFPPVDASQSVDFMLVLPIRDQAAALNFVQRIASTATLENTGGVPVYRGGDLSIAVGTSVMWLSTHTGIDSLFSFGAPENLTQNPAYQKVRATLLADAPLTAYLSGRYLSEISTAQPMSTPAITSILWQAALRLHPAQSSVEDALLASPNFNGIGAAVQITNGVLDVTAVLSVDAQYAVPTLPTTTAGTALLNLIPDDSYLTFASYDFTAALLAGGLSSAWLTPVTNEVVSNSAELTLVPEPITVDSIIAQVQPVILQAESTLGISFGEFNGLLNGEYAVAVFPRADETPGAALYVQSSDPQRLIAALENASRLILTSPTPVEQWFMLERANVGGIEVTFVSGQGLSERLALGVLNGNVLFVTQESALQQVITAASDTTTPSPIFDLRGAFGEEQEAFFYALPRQMGIFPSLNTLWGALDVRENGLFVLRLQGQTGE